MVEIKTKKYSDFIGDDDAKKMYVDNLNLNLSRAVVSSMNPMFEEILGFLLALNVFTVDGRTATCNVLNVPIKNVEVKYYLDDFKTIRKINFLCSNLSVSESLLNVDNVNLTSSITNICEKYNLSSFIASLKKEYLNNLFTYNSLSYDDVTQFLNYPNSKNQNVTNLNLNNNNDKTLPNETMYSDNFNKNNKTLLNETEHNDNFNTNNNDETIRKDYNDTFRDTNNNDKTLLNETVRVDHYDNFRDTNNNAETLLNETVRNDNFNTNNKTLLNETKRSVHFNTNNNDKILTYNNETELKDNFNTNNNETKRNGNFNTYNNETVSKDHYDNFNTNNNNVNGIFDKDDNFNFQEMRRQIKVKLQGGDFVSFNDARNKFEKHIEENKNIVNLFVPFEYELYRFSIDHIELVIEYDLKYKVIYRKGDCLSIIYYFPVKLISNISKIDNFGSSNLNSLDLKLYLFRINVYPKNKSSNTNPPTIKEITSKQLYNLLFKCITMDNVLEEAELTANLFKKYKNELKIDFVSTKKLTTNKVMFIVFVNDIFSGNYEPMLAYTYFKDMANNFKFKFTYVEMIVYGIVLSMSSHKSLNDYMNHKIRFFLTIVDKIIYNLENDKKSGGSFINRHDVPVHEIAKDLNLSIAGMKDMIYSAEESNKYKTLFDYLMKI